MNLDDKFILKKGQQLFCLSYGSPEANPLRNIYFLSMAEAILSLFRNNHALPYELSLDQNPQSRRDQIPDIYATGCYLDRDLILRRHRIGSVTERLIHGPLILSQLNQALEDDCRTDNSGADGFVLNYPIEIYQTYIAGQPEIISGRLTSYAICQPNILIPMGAFQIIKPTVLQLVKIAIEEWYSEVLSSDNSSVGREQVFASRAYWKRRDPITVAVIQVVFQKKLFASYEPYLSRVFSEPESAGWASSPIRPGIIGPSTPSPFSSPANSPGGPQPMSLSPASPLQSPLSPLSPSVPFTSPGGTPFDPFRTVPAEIIRLIALGMKPAAIANFCLTSAVFQRLICDNEVFWQEKVRIDYGKPLEDERSKHPQASQWTWKRYYQELEGRVTYEQALTNLTEEERKQVEQYPGLRRIQALNQIRAGVKLGPLPEMIQLQDEAVRRRIDFDDPAFAANDNQELQNLEQMQEDNEEELEVDRLEDFMIQLAAREGYAREQRNELFERVLEDETELWENRARQDGLRLPDYVERQIALVRRYRPQLEEPVIQAVRNYFLQYDQQYRNWRPPRDVSPTTLQRLFDQTIDYDRRRYERTILFTTLLNNAAANGITPLQELERIWRYFDRGDPQLRQQFPVARRAELEDDFRDYLRPLDL